MTALSGTTALVRLAIRRDRVLLPVWILVLAGSAASSAASAVGLYPTAASRIEASESLNRTQSLVALYGRIYDVGSLGAVAMVKLSGLGALAVAVLAIMIVIRHTRAEEETGRLELVGATVVGRYAPLTAAFLVMTVASLVLGGLTALSLIAAGLPVGGSLAFGLSWAGVGIAFTAVAGVAAQLTTSARGATGVAVVALGVVYMIRALGDVSSVSGPRWLSWLSPIGWGQQIRPYAGNRWWVLVVMVAFAAAVAAASYALVDRRDLGAGLLPDRPGPATASPGLRTPLALAWRLQRGTLLAWLVGFAVLGLIVGGLASNVSDFLGSAQARDFIARLGGQKGLTNAFLATELGFLGVFASAYGVQAALRMRAEETARHAEPLLATATGRVRWALSHIAIAVGGTSLLLLVAGVCTGTTRVAQTGRAADFGAVLSAALIQLPAVWVLTGIVVAAFGLAPRLSAVGWAAFTGFLLLGELGPAFRLNHWIMDLSPFGHTPRLPGVPLRLTPLAALTVLAAVLTAAGLAAFRHRDIS